MKLFRIAVTVVLLAANCLNLSAAEATNAAPKTMPRQPWHLADVWWAFENFTPHFSSLDLEVTIDRDVPETVNLYIAPCGLGELSGISFYGGAAIEHQRLAVAHQPDAGASGPGRHLLALGQGQALGPPGAWRGRLSLRGRGL